ncbi:MAG TPA: hypothetical protein DEG17_14380 [Cyanobacteria bacterium UBA11149]|nr:hypothetical protein [Cyanobacteria bacterium UBA11367]HBE60853.1 hypothetical protein [Cyanobacteria bacterium UBA11366]HBK64205.1 hypothetical protein [Cyanobacteria bacterium UBA11166]HBR72188.1 hypothetical protein [Cyanobacteria bacterium UBA11159]HBS69764.1 hypothetical protein [Cyanobacteria bacterium UBA11153]HBW90025.1 hypothetical protein [Cyanobacteria bacterium UBA11149]HCA93124.1 hypothetical protein [Cyanobacteria bacterium UBA9226]
MRGELTLSEKLGSPNSLLDSKKAEAIMWWNQAKTLNDKQKNLISATNKKWRLLADSTQPINQDTATSALKYAYKLMGKAEPFIVFFDSPHSALVALTTQLVQELDSQLIQQIEIQTTQGFNNEGELLRQLIGQLTIPLKKQLEKHLGTQLASQIDRTLTNELNSKIDLKIPTELKSQIFQTIEYEEEEQRHSQLVSQLENQLNSQLVQRLIQQLKPRMQHSRTIKILTRLEELLQKQESSLMVGRLGNLFLKPLFYTNSIHPIQWINRANWLDIGMSVFKCAYPQKNWEIFQLIASNCGWIFPFEKTCIVCHRPIKLSRNRNRTIHAEGDVALAFADGYSLYLHHGVVIPKKYGQLPPEAWQAEWLLTEHNAEVRRVLLEGIGYDRICQELEATTVSSWREYTLLRIDKFIDHDDGMPVFLLKMTCPSTGFIHALRVPPDIQSARNAIRWINWGVDPERFAIES